MKLEIFKLITIALLVFSSSVYADSVCDAILKYGLYDRSDVLDLRTKFNIVRNAHCSSEARNTDSSGGLGVEDLFSASANNSSQMSKEFCGSTFNQIKENEYFKSVVTTASPVVANAWENCIKSNSAGFSHFIQPTVDPATFVYKIIYTPDGKPYSSKITAWGMSGAQSCLIPQPEPGQKIDSAGYEIQCTRLPESAVVISANAESGTKNLRFVQLPPYVEEKEPEIAKPYGVLDVGSFWPPNKDGKTTCETRLGKDWRKYSWDGKSKITYCKRTGKGSTYVSDMNIIQNTSRNVSCAEKLGQGWSNSTWDGKSKSMLCKQTTSFEVLKTGQVQYLKDIVTNWPGECPRDHSKLFKINYSGISFCTKWGKLLF